MVRYLIFVHWFKFSWHTWHYFIEWLCENLLYDELDDSIDHKDVLMEPPTRPAAESASKADIEHLKHQSRPVDVTP